VHFLDLSPLELAYCGAVLLLAFALRGSLGFGGAVGLPFLALVFPVKILAPAWNLVGIVSSAAIIGRDRRHVARREFLGLLPGCALGVAAGLFLFKTLDAVLLARALGTMFGAMASIFFAMYLDASGANKQAFHATLSAMLLTLSVARAIGYAAVDELTLDSFILCAAALPAMGLGLLVGDRIHSGLSQAAFQRVVCAALFLCGVPLLLK
jgi:uncharacterized membrane protein YfcA